MHSTFAMSVSAGPGRTWCRQGLRSGDDPVADEGTWISGRGGIGVVDVLLSTEWTGRNVERGAWDVVVDLTVPEGWLHQRRRWRLQGRRLGRGSWQLWWPEEPGELRRDPGRPSSRLSSPWVSRRAHLFREMCVWHSIFHLLTIWVRFVSRGGRHKVDQEED